MKEARYIQSKEIKRQEHLPYNFLNLCKNRKREYILFLSKVARPNQPKQEDIFIFPGKTKDSNLAQKLFEEINSIEDFQKKSRNQILNVD